MNTLTVWGFPRTARRRRSALSRSRATGRASATPRSSPGRPDGARRSRAARQHHAPGRAVGRLLGRLLGLVFLVPLAGPDFGAAAGAVAGGLADFGVPDDFVKRIRDTVVPGTSAMFDRQLPRRRELVAGLDGPASRRPVRALARAGAPAARRARRPLKVYRPGRASDQRAVSA